MKKKKAKPGPKLLSPYTKEMDELIKDTYINLPENKRRIYAAVEALKLPRGGKRYISKLLGCSRSTIRKGIAELNNKDPESVAGNRIRAKGAGRKPAIETIENIDEVFLSVIDNHIAGDPMNEKIRWTNLSQKKIAEKMKDEGIEISVTVVQNLLKKHGFVKRKALKKKPIGSCKQRNEQFEKIAQLKQQYQNDGNPIVSVDTKKKNF
jgi:hypothetical protein